MLALAPGSSCEWANSPRHRLHSRQKLERLHPCKRRPRSILVPVSPPASNTIPLPTHSAHASLAPLHPVTLTSLSTLTITPPSPSPPSSTTTSPSHLSHSLFLLSLPLPSLPPSRPPARVAHTTSPLFNFCIVTSCVPTRNHFPPTDHCSFPSLYIGPP